MSYIVDSFLIMSKQNLNFYMADPTPKIFDLSFANLQNMRHCRICKKGMLVLYYKSYDYYLDIVKSYIKYYG